MGSGCSSCGRGGVDVPHSAQYVSSSNAKDGAVGEHQSPVKAFSTKSMNGVSTRSLLPTSPSFCRAAGSGGGGVSAVNDDRGMTSFENSMASETVPNSPLLDPCVDLFNVGTNDRKPSQLRLNGDVSLQSFVRKMRRGDGLSALEVSLLSEIFRLGNSYLVPGAAKGVGENEDIYYEDAVLFYPSSRDDIGVNTSETKGLQYDPSRGVMRQLGESPLPSGSHGGGLGIGVVPETTGTPHCTIHHRSATSLSEMSETSGYTSEGGAYSNGGGSDPDLARRIREGNALVQSTWKEAYAMPDFVVRLLQRQRQMDPLLAEAVFFKIEPKTLAGKLGTMINDAIQMLDKPDAFIPVMMHLGVKHIMYGVGDEHMSVFREALLEVLKEVLQPPLTLWDEALAKEWKRVLGLMMSMMAQGQASPHGLKETRRSKSQGFRTLLRCWRSVKDREDTGLQRSFVELLHEGGSKVISSERHHLFANLVARRRMFMEMMSKLFEVGLEDPEAVHLLRELGARHVAYGLKKEDYLAYTAPFLDTVARCAHPSTINPMVKYRLRSFWRTATSKMIEGSTEARCSFALRLAPKDAPFAIVFTDIEASTSLWENQPVAMEAAVEEHHHLMRDLIHDHNGYEAKTIGDSFMIAFKSLADAVTMSLRLQVELMRASTEDLHVDAARCESSGPEDVWNSKSVRVRVGVHWCTDAMPKFDVVHKRYDFYGNDVNVASRVQDAACGGQVLCTSATLDALLSMAGQLEAPSQFNARLSTLSGEDSRARSLKEVLLSSVYMRDVQLKGVQTPVTLMSLFPPAISGRVHGLRKKDVFVTSPTDSTA